MTNKKIYSDSRPSIPTDLRRTVEVESGHSCAIKNCGEHTYLEIHHIDENRNNNTLENLILLCDKHHKMAHHGIIDRKSLKQYKELLSNSLISSISEKIDKLTEIICQDKNLPKSKHSDNQPVNNKIEKRSPARSEILNFVLIHAAIVHYEKQHDLYFEHQVEFFNEKSTLLLDALRQDDDFDKDIIIEVQYIRKPYMDAPIYSSWLNEKLEIYEMITGRKARGVLLIVVGREKMLGDNYLTYTKTSVEEYKDNIELQVYSCEQIGFHPGSVSAALFACNINKQENCSNVSNELGNILECINLSDKDDD